MADYHSECSDDSFEIVSAETCEERKDDVLTSTYKPLVKFEDIFDVYPCDSDIVARISVSENYEKSVDDFVNVMPLGWTNADQAFCCAKLIGDYVKFNVNDLPHTSQDIFYQLCYTSKDDTIVGVSAPFSFRETLEDELIEYQKEQNKDFWAFRSRFSVLMQLYWNSLLENKKAVVESVESKTSECEEKVEAATKHVEQNLEQVQSKVREVVNEEDNAQPVIGEGSIGKYSEDKKAQADDAVDELILPFEKNFKIVLDRLDENIVEKLAEDPMAEKNKPSHNSVSDVNLETNWYQAKKKNDLDRCQAKINNDLAWCQAMKNNLAKNKKKLSDGVDFSPSVSHPLLDAGFFRPLQDFVSWQEWQESFQSCHERFYQQLETEKPHNKPSTSSSVSEIEIKTEMGKMKPVEPEASSLHENVILRHEVNVLLKYNKSLKKKLNDTHSDLDYFKKLYIGQTEEMKQKDERYGAKLAKMAFEKEKLLQEKINIEMDHHERLKQCSNEYSKLMMKYQRLMRRLHDQTTSTDNDAQYLDTAPNYSTNPYPTNSFYNARLN